MFTVSDDILMTEAIYLSNGFNNEKVETDENDSKSKEKDIVDLKNFCLALSVYNMFLDKKGMCKNYSSEDVEQAIDAIKKGVSLRKAAKAFNIPYATLHGKYKKSK